MGLAECWGRVREWMVMCLQRNSISQGGKEVVSRLVFWQCLFEMLPVYCKNVKQAVRGVRVCSSEGRTELEI